MDTSRSSDMLKWAVGVAVLILLAIGIFVFRPLIFPENAKVSLRTPVERHIGTKAGSEETLDSLEKEQIPGLMPAPQRGAIISDAAAEENGLDFQQPSEEPVELNRQSNGAPEPSRPGDSRAKSGTRKSETASKASRGSTAIRSVRKGESLSRIAQQTYGSSSPQYVDWLRRHNPHIIDPDIILPGQKIVLPEYNKE